MKKMKIIVCCILLMSTFLGCSKKEVGAEVGKWHAEVKVQDISQSITESDSMILTMLAGSTLFEIDVEFTKDGTFSYVTNMDKLQDEISKSVSAILGFFIDFDISLFTDRIVEAAIQNSKQEYHGSYVKSESNLITAEDGDQLFFKLEGKKLIQIDDAGNEIMEFIKETDDKA